jgi:bifunctional ADP-heptose synthase (sugar kinase/adenylyltransferase)
MYEGAFIMALVPDDSCVLSYKGDLPSVADEDRAMALALMSGVDAALIHTDQPPIDSIGDIGVHTLFKGVDYAGKDIPEIQALKVLEDSDSGDKVEREILYLDHGKMYSCTSIRDSIKRTG